VRQTKPKASLTGLFFAVTRAGRVSNEPMFGAATKKTGCAYWQASALNLLRVSQEHGSKGDVASRLNVSVPVEIERRPYGSSSL
jgi:hypothetical protein